MLEPHAVQAPEPNVASLAVNLTNKAAGQRSSRANKRQPRPTVLPDKAVDALLGKLSRTKSLDEWVFSSL